LLFTDSPLAVMVALALATVTGLWFCRPVVIAEFERGKRSTLAIGQSVIALTLVVCWGLTILFTPRAAEGTAKVHPYHAPKKAARTARR